MMTGHLKSKSKLRRRGYHIAAKPSKIAKHDRRVLKYERKHAVSTSRFSSYIRDQLAKCYSKGFNEDFIKSLQNITDKYDNTFTYNSDTNPRSTVKSPGLSQEIVNPLRDNSSEAFDEDFNKGMENLIENYDDILRNLVNR